MASLTQPEAAVLFERVKEHIALITINRPAARNAINGDVAASLQRYVKAIEEDDSIWVGVLTGSGDRAFCAGADMNEVAAGRRKLFSTPEGGFAGFVHAPRAKPWIAAVNATAVGGGTEIALACDMIVAAEAASFSLPEVRRGLIAGAGGVFRLPRAIPRAIAMELIATGAPLPASRALALGMVNRVVPQAEVVTEALKLATEICANAPVPVRESLKIARVVADLSEAELWERSRAAGILNRTTEDYKEGPRAFMEKREPNWKGH